MKRNLVITAVLLAGVLAYSFIQVHHVAGQEFTVTDGDTVRVIGEAKGARLVGFNAQETRNARCAKKSELGKRATKRLIELVATADMELVKVPCACKPGTEGTDACNYGRSCGIFARTGATWARY